MPTHDAATHSLGQINRLLLGHVSWKVDKACEFWNRGRLHFIHITEVEQSKGAMLDSLFHSVEERFTSDYLPLKLGRNWWFQRNTLSLGLRHIHWRHVVWTRHRRRHASMVRAPHMTFPIVAHSHGRCQRMMCRHGGRNVKRHRCHVSTMRYSSSKISHTVVMGSMW